MACLQQIRIDLGVLTFTSTIGKRQAERDNMTYHCYEHVVFAIQHLLWRDARHQPRQFGVGPRRQRSYSSTSAIETNRVDDEATYFIFKEISKRGEVLLQTDDISDCKVITIYICTASHGSRKTALRFSFADNYLLSSSLTSLIIWASMLVAIYYSRGVEELSLRSSWWPRGAAWIYLVSLKKAGSLRVSRIQHICATSACQRQVSWTACLDVMAKVRFVAYDVLCSSCTIGWWHICHIHWIWEHAMYVSCALTILDTIRRLDNGCKH